MYYISQILGFSAFILSLTAFHKKTKEKILGNMLLSNILNLIHYLLLGAYSGCITKVMAIFRDSFIILKNKHPKLNSKLIFFLFIVLYILIGIITFNGIYTLFPILAASLYFIPIWNGNELVIRKTAFYTTFLWLAYNIIVFSIAGIVSNITTIISTYIAIKNTKKG